ncbi:3-deoxy-7-phosphoheptulonate synthase [Vibrio mangrovi]|uniref:Phospho-2-dehydro-3-deoxyheptonate aldolase n=1 Tax=Vibrio mangrovi TaxID=474394 RepID=A0A1Y6IPV8_9VIBR|nr:3-deoxy-7-phosphoheptulonate synthase [Vibrio mangrovi]MDW6003521.1 3-deoxy-7-phosphoheptulonate synthase [Vibrio mangrovi]SMR99685.1 Phospho-2-dehydro-3-deoxyheptonate aldolase [Vibrio mangrovi]
MLNNERLNTQWQQPVWHSETQLSEIVEVIKILPPLVNFEDVDSLYSQLEKVWNREAIILQAGDCAERFTDSNYQSVSDKLKCLSELSLELAHLTQKEVISVGRIAGQFAKPRSNILELVGNLELPVWRGDNVNGFDQCKIARVHDPKRLYQSYKVSATTIDHIKDIAFDNGKVWMSHEALLLDYERSSVRISKSERRYLSSTHWPWIGVRTLAPGSPHVDFLAQLYNPIACKVSSEISPHFIKELCHRLNPEHRPGRLTLIARFGRNRVQDLQPILEAVLQTNIPVIWMCDPMHGNTSICNKGYKVRRTEDLVAEIEAFNLLLAKYGACNGGLHFETKTGSTPECFGIGIEPTDNELSQIECDPRLTQFQAMHVLRCWAITYGYRQQALNG